MARGSSGESVLQRAARIFEAFTPESTALTLSDLARRADLPLATASRLVNELIDLGLLVRNEQRLIGMGIRMWELALRASPTLSLREAAMPFMEDLHAVVGQHTQVGVLDGADVLFLERLSTPDAVINVTRIAGRLPLHASSAGLVLLAHSGPELLDKVLSSPLPSYTPKTIVSPRQLRSVLAEIRRSGFVLCAGHIHPDATGIAVPVHDARENVIAALAVIVPNDADAATQIPALRAAARGITRTLHDTRSPGGHSTTRSWPSSPSRSTETP